MSRLRVSDIKRLYESSDKGQRFFFSKETMKWFGDTMDSYGVTVMDEKTYLYRKPTKYVNVFGKPKKVGREWFNAWEVDTVTGDLDMTKDSLEEAIYEKIIARY